MSENQSSEEVSTKLDEIKQLVKSGCKLEAIKALREKSGCGLKEAKETVEAIQSKMAELGEIETPKSGCAGMCLLMLTASAALGYSGWV